MSIRLLQKKICKKKKKNVLQLESDSALNGQVNLALEIDMFLHWWSTDHLKQTTKTGPILNFT